MSKWLEMKSQWYVFCHALSCMTNLKTDHSVWTRPGSTPSYPSYTILLHFRILPWCIYSSDYWFSQLEQRLSAGLVSIAQNAQMELCILQKLGGVPVSTDEILKLIDVAGTKAKEANRLVEARLQEDWLGEKLKCVQVIFFFLFTCTSFWFRGKGEYEI